MEAVLWGEDLAGRGHWLRAKVWQLCPSWPTAERGGSGWAPCRVLSSLCASSWLHNGLRKLNRGQVIGLEIDNNKAGSRPVSDAPPAATFEATREPVKPMGKPQPEPTYHSAAPLLCPVPVGGRSRHTAGEWFTELVIPRSWCPFLLPQGLCTAMTCLEYSLYWSTPGSHICGEASLLFSLAATVLGPGGPQEMATEWLKTAREQ